MKTAIITFIHAYNHGAVLQCYALYRKLSEYGIDVEVLDYRPRYFLEVYNVSYLGDLRYFPYRPLKSWIKYTPFLYKKNKRIKAFQRFIFEKIRLSDLQYESKNDIENSELNYDAFIVGSDQVWCDKWTNFDPVFFLDFKLRKAIKKYSYAASFGYKQLPESLETEYYRRLRDWDLYSVREKSGIDILKKITDKPIHHCCDPTLLLTGEEWRKVMRKPRNAPHKYILLYYVNGMEAVAEAAAKYAENHNLKMVSCTSIASFDDIMGTSTWKKRGVHMGSVGPDEFLYLIDHADCVITDSFHGTVFSLLLHKRFLVHAVKNDEVINQRAYELLEIVDGTSKGCLNNIGELDYSLDFEKVDMLLSDYCKQSLEYITIMKQKHQ